MTGEKTEAATGRRVEAARARGDVPISRELPMLLGLGCGLLVLAGLSVSGLRGALPWFAASVGGFAGDPVTVLWRQVWGVGFAVLPVAGAALAATVLGFVLQSGVLLRFAALQPDLSRISPGRGLGRLFSIDNAVQAARALAKFGVLAWAAASLVGRLWRDAAASAEVAPAVMLRMLAGDAGQLAVRLLAGQAVLALADVFWVRFRHGRRLRMSRQELRDEQRETEGNPEIKQRVRQIARLRARRRMMAAVPKAAVVVTNPTHYAIALAYSRGSAGAPRVVAKGADEVAARIREVAREARVPLVENAPLARALYRVDIDTEIPQEFFRAVAEIIAYVWRLRPGPVRR